MESSPENFESLQKLLRLKRYEQPPPRYFNEFSGRVIARLQDGEGRMAPRWWERFGFDLRPIMTVGAGVTACVLLFLGLGMTTENDAAPALAGATLPASDSLIPTAVAQTDSNSTNPVVNAAGSMIPSSFRAGLMPASYQLH